VSAFPPSIPRRTRVGYGALGIGLVLGVWWFLTWPFLTAIEVRRDAVPVKVRGPDGTLVESRTYKTTEVETPRALVNPPALDSPLNTFRKAWEVQLPQHVFWSALRILAGFLVSCSVAVPLGIAMGLFPRLRATISPVVSFLRPLPSIAWVPLAVIWLGVDEVQKLAIIFMGSFSAALIYTIEATIKVDPDLVRAARNLGVSPGRMLWKVLLPAALPNIVSGLKVVLAICWTCVISAEIVGTKYGLGNLIWSRKELSDTAAVLVGMACISGVVLVLDLLFGVLERRLVPWMFLGERS